MEMHAGTFLYFKYIWLLTNIVLNCVGPLIRNIFFNKHTVCLNYNPRFVNPWIQLTMDFTLAWECMFTENQLEFYVDVKCAGVGALGPALFQSQLLAASSCSSIYSCTGGLLFLSQIYSCYQQEDCPKELT